jgi:hypothetical protein
MMVGGWEDPRIGESDINLSQPRFFREPAGDLRVIILSERGSNPLQS